MSILGSLGSLLGLNAGFNNTQQQGTQSGTSNQLGTATSQYLIPGAAPAYNALNSALGQGYQNLQSGLVGSERALQNQVGALQGGLFGQAYGLTNTAGQQEALNLANFYKQQLGQNQADLTNRGLQNSTVQSSVNSGLAQRYAQDALINLPQQVNQQRLGVLSQFGSPIAATQAELGQAGINAATQSVYGQLGSELGLGQQYLNLIGQQGIRTGTTDQTRNDFSQSFGNTNQFGVGGKADFSANG